MFFLFFSSSFYGFVYVQILPLSNICAAEGLYFFFARGQANFIKFYAVMVRLGDQNSKNKSLNLKIRRANFSIISQI